MTEKKNKNLILIDKLLEPFPKEALAPLKKGKDFYLTTIKAQWVIERLNNVFGLCGIGWKYQTQFCRENNYVLAHVKFQYKKEDGEWSEVINGVGGHKINPELADAYKSAETDALTKIASKLGIGNEVFKGLISPKTLIKIDTIEEAKKEIERIKKTKKENVKVDVETGEILEEEVLDEGRKKLWALMKEKGMEIEDAKKFIKDSYGKANSNQLNLDEINDAINFLTDQ